MISNAKESEGLYYLLDNTQKNKKVLYLKSEDFLALNKIMLWHNHLGHPSLPYLKILFPSLFRNKNIRSILCEKRQIAKHTRSSYLEQPYKSSKPFSMIHNDIWGPSREKNIARAQWFVIFINDHTHVYWVFLMKKKSDIQFIIPQFYKLVET